MIPRSHFSSSHQCASSYSHVEYHEVLIRVVFRNVQISPVSVLASLCSTFTTSPDTMARHIRHSGLHQRLPKLLNQDGYISQDELTMIEEYYGALPRLRKYFKRHGK